MAEPRTKLLRWPFSIDVVWLAMPLFVVAIRTLLQPIPMEDYWWHLVMGRWLDATGSVPDSNGLLFTIPVDLPFYDQPWLAQWLMFRIADGGGHVSTVLAHASLLLVAWGTMSAVAYKRGASPVVVGITASLAHYVSASTLMPRTQMFAYIPFVVLVATLLWLSSRSHLERRVLGALAVLVFTVAFWANLHGTFVLAPVLTGLVGLGWALERRRRGGPIDRGMAGFWVVAVLLVLAATAASPGGVANLIYPVAILTATKAAGTTVLEWAPPGLYLQGVLFYAALLGSCLVLYRRRASVTFAELAMFSVTAAIALMSVRGVLWWAMGAVMIAGAHLTATVGAAPLRSPRTVDGVANSLLLAGLLIAVICAVPGGPLFRLVDPAALFGEGRLSDEGEAAVLGASHPVNLVHQLRAEEGRHLFHDQSAGGFVEWMLSEPSRMGPVAFIDQRLELLPPALWDEYFELSRAQTGWRATIEKYDLQVFLLHVVEQELLMAEMEKSSEFQRIAEDRMWRLYVREGRSGSPPVPDGRRK